VVSFALPASSATPSDDPPGFGPLDALLRNVTFTIPPISFSEDGIDVTIENTKCGGMPHPITVGNLALDFTAPPHAPITSGGAVALGDVTVAADGIGVGCASDVHYKAGLIKGTIGITFAMKKSSVTAVINIFDDDHHAVAAMPLCPTRIAIPNDGHQCVGTFVVSDLTFKGDVVAWILEIFRKSLANEIEKELGTLLCSALSEKVPPLLNPLVYNVSQFLRRAGADPPPPFDATPLPRHAVDLPKSLTHSSGAATVDWDNNPLLTLADWAIDNVLGNDAALPRGVVTNAKTRRLGLIEPLVRHATAGTGVVGQSGLHVELIHFDEQLTNTTIGIRSFSIGGLDTVNSLDLLEPYIGAAANRSSDLDFSTWSRVGLKTLNLSLGLWIDLGPGTSVSQGDGTYHLELEINTVVENVEIVAIVLSALRRTVWHDIEIGSLIQTPFGCLLSSLWEGDAGMNLTGLEVKVGALRGPTITGLISSGLDALVDNAAAALKILYGDSVSAALRSLSDGVVRDLVNTVVKLGREFGASVTSCPRAGGGDAPPSPVNWKTSKLLALVSDALSGGEDSSIGVGGWLMDTNALISRASNSLLHRIQEDGSLLQWSLRTEEDGAPSVEIGRDGELLQPFSLSIENVGVVTASVGNITLRGLNTFSEITLLDANQTRDEYTLANSFTLGAWSGDDSAFSNAEKKSSPVALSAAIGIDFLGVDQNNGLRIHDELLVEIALTNLTLEAPIRAMFDTGLAENMNMSALFLSEFTSNGAECLLSTFDALSLGDVSVSIGNTELSIACVESGCTTPSLSSGAFQSLLKLPATQKTITSLLNNMLRTLTDTGANSPLVKGLNADLDVAVEDAAHNCYVGPTLAPTKAPTGEFTSEAISVAVLVGILGTSFFIFIIGGTIVLNSWRRLKQRKMVVRRRGSSASSSSIQSDLPDDAARYKRCGFLHHFQQFALSVASPITVEFESDRGGESHGISPSMAGEVAVKCCSGSTLICHPTIPLVGRLGFLIALLICFGFYLSAHLNVGASVDIRISVLGDEPINIPNLFSFSLGNSVHDMWQAGVYPLAFLIAILSGGWPYLKVLLMFVCWVIPFSDHAFVLTPDFRARMLRWLDALGKWSLIDAYLMILFLVAFRFHIALQLDDGNSGAFVWTVLDIFVHPHWGLHGFVIATVLSLCCSHFIVGYQRLADEADAQNSSTADDQAKTLKSKSALMKKKALTALEKVRANMSRVIHVEKLAPRVRVSSNADLEAPLLASSTVDACPSSARPLQEMASASEDHPTAAEHVDAAESESSSSSPSSSSSSRCACLRPASIVAKCCGGQKLALRSIAGGWKQRWLRKHENARFFEGSASESDCDGNDDSGAAAVRKGTLRCGIMGQLSVVVMIFGSLALLLCGDFVDSFGFAFGGLAGALLPEKETHYSLWTLATNTASVDKYSHHGVWFVHAVFIVFVIIMPLLLLLTLSVLWIVPLTLNAQRALFVFAEVSYAWSSTDVVTLSIIAAQLQIKQFVHFIVGNNCDSINVIISQYAHNVFGPGEDTCFDVESFLDPGCWVLFSSAALSTVACIIITRTCEAALHERIKDELQAGSTNTQHATTDSKVLGLRAIAAAVPSQIHKRDEAPLTACESFTAYVVAILCWLCILRLDNAPCKESGALHQLRSLFN
jgi:hypothetical protein